MVHEGMSSEGTCVTRVSNQKDRLKMGVKVEEIEWGLTAYYLGGWFYVKLGEKILKAKSLEDLKRKLSLGDI